MVLQINLPDVAEKIVTAIIFVISFIFICSRNIKWLPIGRPAASLVGATLMVFFGIVQPEGIGEAVNWDTIILLFGMMLISLFLEKNKIWNIAGKMLLHKCTSPIVFLVRVCAISAIFAAVLTNDTVCVTLTPVVIEACLQAKLPLFPYLMALATSANIGSAALPVGNPQNMIIATASGIHFLTFFKFCAVASVVGMGINILFLCLLFRKELSHLTINIQSVPLADEHPVELVYSPNIRVNLPVNPKERIKKEFSSGAILTTPASPRPSSSSFHTLHTHLDDEWDDDETKLNDVNQVEVDLSDKALTVTPETKDESESTVKEINPEISFILFINLLFVFIISFYALFCFYCLFYDCCDEITAKALWVLVLVLAGFCAGFHMGFTVLLGTVILILIDRQEMDATFNKIDWNLLIFFASLFILVRAFDNEFSEYAWKAIAPFLAVDKNPAKIVMFPLLLLVGSNILSNVPLVLLLSSHLLEQNAPDFTWTLMAFVSTVAGNFTLLGSVANLIVAEKAKKYYQIGFWEYFKVGAASTILVIIAGVPLIVIMG